MDFVCISEPKSSDGDHIHSALQHDDLAATSLGEATWG
jgi:hypothetical protein